MPTTTIAGHEIQVNEEGFLTDPDEWTEDLAPELARPDRPRAHRRALDGASASSARTTPTRARPPRCAGCRPAAASRSSSCSRSSPEAGQEDGLRRRAAQAQRLRLTPTTRPDQHQENPMTATTDAAPLVVPIVRRAGGLRPQARHHLLQGQPRHGLPGPDPGQRGPRRGRRDAPVLHVLGLRHDQQGDDGRPEVHDRSATRRRTCRRALGWACTRHDALPGATNAATKR